MPNLPMLEPPPSGGGRQARAGERWDDQRVRTPARLSAHRTHRARWAAPNGNTTQSEQKNERQRPHVLLAGSMVCLAQWSGSARRRHSPLDDRLRM